MITRLDPGGSAENTLLSCQHLSQRGWTTQLASGAGLRAEDARPSDSPTDSFLIPSLRRDPSPIADVRAFFQIYRLLRRERPQILHTHSAKAGILGRWAGKLARVAHIVHTPHGHVLYGYAKGLKNWLYLLVERLSAPLADRLVALSEGERRESIEHGIGKADQWVVVASGVELDKVTAREPTHVADRVLRAGVVARLEPVKGLDLLISAVGILRRKLDDLECQLFLWGDGEQRRSLEEFAAVQGVTGHVHFVGTGQPVVDFLRTLDIYVQPSRNEGMGRALVLAQTTGLPVVATRVCGIPDVVRDGETGILVETENPEALAAGLQRMIEDAELRTRMAGNARRWVATTDESGHPRFSVEAMLWHLERLYRELTESGR